jgi:hypothetical protein
LSGTDGDPRIGELITVESYVAAVADQGKHPGVAEHDVGLQIRLSLPAGPCGWIATPAAP